VSDSGMTSTMHLRGNLLEAEVGEVDYWDDLYH
jgi:hypothetical protein